MFPANINNGACIDGLDAPGKAFVIPSSSVSQKVRPSKQESISFKDRNLLKFASLRPSSRPV